MSDEHVQERPGRDRRGPGSRHRDRHEVHDQPHQDPVGHADDDGARRGRHQAPKQRRDPQGEEVHGRPCVRHREVEKEAEARGEEAALERVRAQHGAGDRLEEAHGGGDLQRDDVEGDREEAVEDADEDSGRQDAGHVSARRPAAR